MLGIILPTLFLMAQAGPGTPAPAQAPPAAQAAPATQAPAQTQAPAAGSQELKPLSFLSKRFAFAWNQKMNLGESVDGLKINSIFFDKRTVALFKGADFGTRAEVEVTNTANATRTPGFAVAVFDSDNRLLGVATGGPKIGGVRAGDTETFDLSFHQVLERIPRGDHFFLSVELTD